MTERSKRLMMPTDIAHIFLFHPDDLAHAKSWPFDWFVQPFAFAHASEAGRLVGWCTKSDGGFAVRLTDGGLNEREAAYAGPSWTFPYTVRHGQIYLDNGDAIPAQYVRNSPEDYPEYWFDLPNGDYAVTVTAIEWQAEPGAQEEGAETLPNYVVQFAAIAGAVIVSPRRPPDLESLRDAKASDALPQVTPQKVEDIKTDELYPAFVARNVARPGAEFSTEGEAPLGAVVPPGGNDWEVMRSDFVVAAALEVGAPAVIAKSNHSEGGEGGAQKYTFRSGRAVRIEAIDGIIQAGTKRPLGMKGLFRKRLEEVPRDALVTVRVVPWPLKEDSVPTVSAEAMRAAIVADLESGGIVAKRLGDFAEYERLRILNEDSPAVLADWLIDHVEMGAAQRMAISVLPTNKRAAAAMQAFQKLAGA